MAMTESSTVVGVFTEPAQIDVTVEQLQSAGFQNIKFAEPGTDRGDLGTHRGLISEIKRVFSRQGDTEGSIVDDLVNMGVPQDEAKFYQRELELGRGILAVEAPGRREEALAILRANGAYDASSRSATTDPNAPPKDTLQQP